MTLLQEVVEGFVRLRRAEVSPPEGSVAPGHRTQLVALRPELAAVKRCRASGEHSASPRKKGTGGPSNGRSTAAITAPTMKPRLLMMSTTMTRPRTFIIDMSFTTVSPQILTDCKMPEHEARNQQSRTDKQTARHQLHHGRGSGTR